MSPASFVRRLQRSPALTGADPVVQLAQACHDDISQRYARCLVQLADATLSERAPEQRFQRILPPSRLLAPLP
ncbi:hypothetical protein [Rugamonas aquatica]|uniref:Uncharacterized protein n=1 Tax=Rugamonas aquatica TaxID=2743357 RepID=A0A6A7N6Y1_9BURK|nr:hypothetical protein [Rugamonas aquatica]MQA40567.1 hypothetical protein [Rugamonas aquatica]